MYDRKTIRRRRAILAAFMAASLLLLTIYFGESARGALHAIQRGAQAVLGPIESGASRVFKPARDAVNWTGEVLAARGENERLRDEIAALRGRLAQMQTAERDMAQLGGLARLARADSFPEGTQPITARVIARSPTVWHSTVTVNKGAGDGVGVNDPVIAAGGLAGKVIEVTGGTATLRLITDQNSAVSGQVLPDGASGVVKPRIGDSNVLLLDFVQRGRGVKRGATVVTSGFRDPRSELESLFPRGIPIGRVKRVDNEELEVYQSVHLEPFADLRRMDYVQVLTNPRPGVRADVSLP